MAKSESQKKLDEADRLLQRAGGLIDGESTKDSKAEFRGLMREIRRLVKEARQDILLRARVIRASETVGKANRREGRKG